ncbi:MAG: single-stranded DNA-binding protein [Candidatus Alcyoniella australis]|nr:single-stranded DNA-binding protein [Candidatus Alcyoniella australis]
MAVTINRVFVSGNLTRDPELRYTPSGTAVCKMAIAANRSYRQGEDLKEETSFFDIVAWGRTGETSAEYLSKGRPILVEGRLQQSRWQNPDGQNRSKVEIVADRVHFLGGPRDQEAQGGGGGGGRQAHPEPPVDEPLPDDDIPF